MLVIKTKDPTYKHINFIDKINMFKVHRHSKDHILKTLQSIFKSMVKLDEQRKPMEWELWLNNNVEL